MAMTTGTGKGSQSDINVTPLVDVVLVLLIIFMVVTPLLQVHHDAGLPAAGGPEHGEPPVVVSVKHDGLRLGPRQVTDSELASWLSRWSSARRPDARQILLTGEDRVSLGSVVHVMDIAQGAGVETVSVVDPID